MTLDVEDTIVALSSAEGPGGRAIVRMSGSAALDILATVFAASESLAAQRRRYAGLLRLKGLHSPLPADALVWPAPHSYTGQELIEIHTVSSPPLIELLIGRLLDAGCRAAQPGEFTMRGFLAGKLDLTQAEAVLGVIHAGSRDELQQSLRQLAGGIAHPMQELRDDILNLLAEVEAGLDFAEEDIRFVDQTDLLYRLAKGMAQVTLLQKQLTERAVGNRPFRVVLAGRPNAGKSSLFNALTKGRALVSTQTGTTRDFLVKQLKLDNVTIELVDTAGIQESGGAISEQAQRLSRDQLHQADLVLHCLEATQQAAEEDELDLSSTLPVLRVATKCDLAVAPPGLVATSVATGVGIDSLRAMLLDRAYSHYRPSLAPSLSRCRHHVDALLGHLRQAHAAALYEDPAEILALELRSALNELGEMTGAIYTDDILDRVFSRFCIGK